MNGEFTIPVYYEDTDFTGYVYHANYLKFFERAREELFGRQRLKEMFESGKHFVVKEVQVTYHKPARHGDELIIKSRLAFDHAVVVNCHQTVLRSSDGEKLVSGLIQLVTINERGFPVRLPSEFALS